jgi:hypothetical protein
MKTFAFALLAWLTGVAASSVAFAQSNATGGPTPSPPGAEAYFVDLKDGATIGPQTTIHFGLRGMGIAPAGSDRPNTGHHHLLIDADLPPLDQPIPNDFNHLHFGAGQTEVDLSLSPGPHTLQLLLGDKNHVPHSPPVMSERVHVTVVETPPEPLTRAAPAQSAPVAQPAPAAEAAPAPASDATPRRRSSAPGAREFILWPADGAVVPLTLKVRFGLLNMTVAPAGVETPNSGHHHLLIDTPLPPLDQPIPSDENHLHFGDGQTEGTITLTPGRHTLQLLFGDADHVPHDPPVYSPPITVIATSVAARDAAGWNRRLAPRREAEPPRFGAAVKRPRRAEPREANTPAARSPAPAPSEIFNDFRHCQPGTHSVSSPSSAGYRCAVDQ